MSPLSRKLCWTISVLRKNFQKKSCAFVPSTGGDPELSVWAPRIQTASQKGNPLPSAFQSGVSTPLPFSSRSCLSWMCKENAFDQVRLYSDSTNFLQEVKIFLLGDCITMLTVLSKMHYEGMMTPHLGWFGGHELFKHGYVWEKHLMLSVVKREPCLTAHWL